MIKKIPQLIIITCICFGFSLKVCAQSDTGKVKPQTYIQLYYSLTNTAGTLGDKSNLSGEVGKQ